MFGPTLPESPKKKLCPGQAQNAEDLSVWTALNAGVLFMRLGSE